MLRLLMGYQDLEVVEVALAVVAPGAGEDVLKGWMAASFLSHGEGFEQEKGCDKCSN